MEHRIADLDRPIPFPDALSLLNGAGFLVEERFRDYDRRPWGPGSRRHLWTAR